MFQMQYVPVEERIEARVEGRVVPAVRSRQLAQSQARGDLAEAYRLYSFMSVKSALSARRPTVPPRTAA